MSRKSIKLFEAFTGKPAERRATPTLREQAAKLRKQAAQLLDMAAQFDEAADVLGFEK